MIPDYGANSSRSILQIATHWIQQDWCVILRDVVHGSQDFRFSVVITVASCDK